MKRNFFSLFWLFAVVWFISCSKGNDSLLPDADGAPVSQEVFDPLLIDAAKTELTGTDAGQVAKLFMCRQGPVAATRAAFADKTVAETFPINGDDGQPLAYVVNYQGGGYGIVSATKKYAPILAFSDEGRITPAGLEGNGLAFWKACIAADIARSKATLCEDSPEYADTRLQWREYEKPEPAAAFSTTMQDANYWYLQLRADMMGSVGYCTSNRQMFYSAASAFGVVYMDQARMEQEFQEMDRVLKIEYGVMDAPPVLIWGEGLMSEDETKVMPLLKTYWNQGYPYNELIEMKDHGEGRKPAGCVAIAVAQILNYYRYPTELRFVVAPSYMVESIDWSKTQEKFASDDNEEIPKLVWVVNRGVFTHNGDDDSGSTIDDAQAFLKFNGYVARIHSGSTLDWILKDEVMQQRPVYVRGENSDGGHAWVCDGYYSCNFHYNILAYQLTSTEKRHFPTNSYYKILDRSRVSRSSEFFHMNWGWGSQFEVDPSALSEEIGGWYRSVFNGAYKDDVRILQIIR